MSPPEKPAVLVIRFVSTFGDLAMAAPVFQSLRLHHRGARFVLVARPRSMIESLRPFALFDEHILDDRARPCGARGSEFRALIRRLRRNNFSQIYDFNRNDRTVLLSGVLRLRVGDRPKVVSGRLKWGEHFGRSWSRILQERAGVVPVTKMDLSNIDAISPDLEAALPDGGFAILAPGAGGRDDKRWPARCFAEIARRLQTEGVRPAVVGTEAEGHAMEKIRERCPEAINFLGKTRAVDLVHLGARARVMVTGDTGPAHWASLGGAPMVSLFGAYPPASVFAPAGAFVIECDPLRLLQPDKVWQAVKQKLEKSDA
ncbi:MAG: glycosyltransferase family 9 protein [Alphaproteobacteria bacterium]|nr:glycosyltransferase family 9 protein [Alphaproteobacteria bacterium]